MHDCQLEVTFFDPDPSQLGRGQLFLVGVGRQQQDKGHSDKQDEKTSPHGGTLRIRVCRAGRKVGRAAVHERKHSPFSRVGQGLRVRQSWHAGRSIRACRAVFPAWGKARRVFDLAA